MGIEKVMVISKMNENELTDASDNGCQWYSRKCGD
jgi:hypothetical protein